MGGRRKMKKKKKKNKKKKKKKWGGREKKKKKKTRTRNRNRTRCITKQNKRRTSYFFDKREHYCHFSGRITFHGGCIRRHLFETKDTSVLSKGKKKPQHPAFPQFSEEIPLPR